MPTRTRPHRAPKGAMQAVVLGLCGGLLCGCGGSADPLAAGPACAAPAGHTGLSGTVRRVSDGDTFVLETADTTETVRLQGVDAPEWAQAFGPQAQQALQQQLLHTPVQVTYAQRDRYGRALGQVWGAACQDVNQHLLATGMAWFYSAYACDLPPARRALYQQAHQQARAQGLGLWAQASPTAPWVYRNGQDPGQPVCTDP